MPRYGGVPVTRSKVTFVLREGQHASNEEADEVCRAELAREKMRVVGDPAVERGNGWYFLTYKYEYEYKPRSVQSENRSED
jgi:hypothetical protein